MIILVMGVTGSGKTTVGERLARRLGWDFLDADNFHSASNIEKMKHGIPLTDADREPWLRAIHEELVRRSSAGQSAVLGCSALKQSYRDELSKNVDLKTIYLKGSYDLLAERIHERQHHFAGESILAGQFADLEVPGDAMVLDVRKTPEELVSEAIARLNLSIGK